MFSDPFRPPKCRPQWVSSGISATRSHLELEFQLLWLFFSPIDGYKPLVRLKQGCPQTIAQTLKWGVNLYLSTLENIIPHMVVKNGEFHPGRLTWNLQITQLKRKIIFQTIIFRFDVNLPGCSSHGMVQPVKQYHPTKITSEERVPARWWLDKRSLPVTKLVMRSPPDVEFPGFLYLSSWCFFFQPIWKNMIVKMDHHETPNNSGEHGICLGNHHLVFLAPQSWTPFKTGYFEDLYTPANIQVHPPFHWRVPADP